MTEADIEEQVWSMPVVFLLDKQNPATTTAICEASAKAVVALLTDERVLTPAWSDAIRSWQQGQIRKVVRRAKMAQFQAAAVVPNVLISHAGAKARAFLPATAVPTPLQKMQVSGSEPLSAGSPSVAAMVKIFLNPALSMSVGKKAAQCAHGAQLALLGMSESQVKAWKDAGFPLSVTHATAEQWAELEGVAVVEITDAGFTEIAPGSKTVRVTF